MAAPAKPRDSDDAPRWSSSSQWPTTWPGSASSSPSALSSLVGFSLPPPPGVVLKKPTRTASVDSGAAAAVPAAAAKHSRSPTFASDESSFTSSLLGSETLPGERWNAVPSGCSSLPSAGPSLRPLPLLLPVPPPSRPSSCSRQHLPGSSSSSVPLISSILHLHAPLSPSECSSDDELLGGAINHSHHTTLRLRELLSEEAQRAVRSGAKGGWLNSFPGGLPPASTPNRPPSRTSSFCASPSMPISAKMWAASSGHPAAPPPADPPTQHDLATACGGACAAGTAALASPAGRGSCLSRPMSSLSNSNLFRNSRSQSADLTNVVVAEELATACDRAGGRGPSARPSFFSVSFPTPPPSCSSLLRPSSVRRPASRLHGCGSVDDMMSHATATAAATSALLDAHVVHSGAMSAMLSALRGSSSSSSLAEDVAVAAATAVPGGHGHAGSSSGSSTRGRLWNRAGLGNSNRLMQQLKHAVSEGVEGTDVLMHPLHLARTASWEHMLQVSGWTLRRTPNNMMSKCGRVGVRVGGPTCPPHPSIHVPSPSLCGCFFA